jgi:hypothetical protein
LIVAELRVRGAHHGVGIRVGGAERSPHGLSQLGFDAGLKVTHEADRA